MQTSTHYAYLVPSSKHKYLMFLMLGLTGLAVTWWKLAPTDNPEKAGSATAQVVRRDLSSTVLATGVVKPQVGAEVRVGARIGGKVIQLHANIGDLVKKGQIIAELEKADLEAKVRQRQAELLEDRAHARPVGLHTRHVAEFHLIENAVHLRRLT